MYFPLRTQMHLYADTQNFMLSRQKLTHTSSLSLLFYSHFFHPSSITVTSIQSVFKLKLCLGSHYFSVFRMVKHNLGARGGVVVKALRYKPAGHGFDSQWCHWNFSVT